MSESISGPVRTAIRVVIVAVTLAAWWITYSETRNMGLLMRLGVPMALGMEGWAGLTSFIAFTGMWTVMMIAMMLPSSYPTLLLHRTVYLKRQPDLRGGTVLFALGYFAVWSAAGAIFYLGYVAIGHWRSFLLGSTPNVLRLAGASLIFGGIYQWSRLKLACLKHCQSPLHFIMEHWSDGLRGSLLMGTVHGLYCFGCCWGLMLVLFIMGVMHLGWMAAVGVLILLEKITVSPWLPKVAGTGMIALGALSLIWPSALPGLSSQITLP
jgi:predicted metal-binding membrane protein